MKINIIGGGPAGMYFAILMKKAEPGHEITVYERNGPDDTFGWGVVFSGKTRANLRAADEESHAEITRAFAAWDNVDVVHRQEKVSIHGNSFSGIARLQLLKILQQRCEQLGVQLRFRSEVPDLDSLKVNCDLLVAADGVNSTARRQYSNHFLPTLDVRPNRYIWYGTHQLFHGLTLTFRENEAGVFAAHSYKFNQTTSTFIIECDQETWDRAGFATMSDDETRGYLEIVFAPDLDGQPLLSNNSKWINFLLVKNDNWFFEKVVLIGDALHTAHFSIGSGTKLALEDAIALFESFGRSASVGEALKDFERTRKPVIEEYQAAAFESMRWFENTRDYMNLTPIELAHTLMTRSGRVSDDDLRRRDPEFIARYERERGHCFRKGTLIKGAEGWKEIDTLRVGDLVWTHRGRLKPVVGVQRRPHVGRLVGLCLQTDERRVWCTPEQHFLAAFTPSPQAERGKGGEEGSVLVPTPNPTPRGGRGKSNTTLGVSKPGLATLRRNLRSQSTAAEVFLWDRIRGRRLCGAKFRRQHSLGAHYIVDFYCAESKLAIELDGSAHDSAYARWSDGIRHRQLEYAGVRVLRFRNERVIGDIENVLREIGSCLETSADPEMSPGYWRKSEELACDDNLISNEQGEISSITSIENIFVNETLYDLIVEDDSSFVTAAGVVQNASTPGG
jgi:2-polyprenyl-6-methoxyphenol hydroxylase-like FAD-dependent oxidoreductase/very-short-patch-repair endonuclease